MRSFSSSSSSIVNRDHHLEPNVFGILEARRALGTCCLAHPATGGVRANVLGSLVWGLHRRAPTPLVGHHGCVNTIRWNTSGSHLVSGSDDRCLRIWQTNGLLQHTLRTRHRQNVFDAQFKPGDDDTVASCAADGALCMNSVHRGAEAGNMVWVARSAMALKLCFYPRSPEVLLCSFADGTVRLFDLRLRGQPVSCITAAPGRGHALVVAEFSPCGNLIACGADDMLRLLDLRRSTDSQPDLHHTNFVGRIRPPPNRSPALCVSGICWARDGRHLLANYMAGDIMLFDTYEARQTSRAESIPGSSAGSQVSESSDPISSPREKQVEASAAIRMRFVGRENRKTFAKEVRFLLGDRFVATGGDCGHLFVWRNRDGALVQKLRADGSICNCVAPHPVLPLVAVSGIEHTVKLFDVAGDRLPLTRKRSSKVMSGLSVHPVASFSALASAAPEILEQSRNRASQTLARASTWGARARQFACRRIAAVRGFCRCPARSSRQYVEDA